MIGRLSDEEVRHGEAVDADLDRFISRRAEGWREANATEAMWAESERKYAAIRQRELRTAWCEYYRTLARAHRVLSLENEGKARRIMLEEVS